MKIAVYLFSIIIVLSSCSDNGQFILGEDASSADTVSKPNIKLKQNTVISDDKRTNLKEANEGLSASIIGNTSFLNGLEIAQQDFSNQMNWQEAQNACAALGDGWRLPTWVELRMIIKYNVCNDKRIRWSSSDASEIWGDYDHFILCSQGINGVAIYSQLKKYPNYVRAVRGALKSVIGKPKKIGGLEIAENDFYEGKMLFYKAQSACAALGDGWRLPTIEELNIMRGHRNEIGGFETDIPYWSSTQAIYDDCKNCQGVLVRNFSFEHEFDASTKKEHGAKLLVRAVRSSETIH